MFQLILFLSYSLFAELLKQNIKVCHILCHFLMLFLLRIISFILYLGQINHFYCTLGLNIIILDQIGSEISLFISENGDHLLSQKIPTYLANNNLLARGFFIDTGRLSAAGQVTYLNHRKAEKYVNIKVLKLKKNVNISLQRIKKIENGKLTNDF